MSTDVTLSSAAVNDDTFEEIVLKSPVPVLIDFWAPWCGPCRMIAPLIDQIATEYTGRLTCVKLNTDESPGAKRKAVPSRIMPKHQAISTCLK